MSQPRLSRRQAVKALGYGAMLALSACHQKTIILITATPATMPTLTSVANHTPASTVTHTPSRTSKSTGTAQASLTLLRPLQIKGLHVPYTFLEKPIDFPAFEALMLGTGANCAVIDIKVEGGKIAIPFEHPLKPHYTNNPGFDYAQVDVLVHWLLDHHYYPVARQVVMTDTPLATAHRDLAYTFHSREAYVDLSGELWVDPERPEVADYNATISVAAAKMGFLEVQLDYIRYPEADFATPIERRVDAISATLTTIQSALRQRALLTIDVLDDSTRAYPDNIADGGYGQHIATLARIVDGVCPMLYPDRLHQDIDVDYYQFVHDGTSRAAEKVLSGGSMAFVNPWIQAYYAAGLTRIQQQADGAFEAGAVGVFAWNSTLHYPDGIYRLTS
ncbi:MAG: hypothetical protein JXB07_00985 [Anaerolineae bacterium]|nr:hypothetical protein [Anaerolineae bacterium]